MGLARLARFPIRALAAPHLRELSEAEGETSFLTIRNGDDSVCLARHPGSFAIKVLSIEVGARSPLGVGVSGLILLAGLPEAERLAIMQRNARRLDALRVDGDDLRHRLKLAMKRDYAYAPAGVVHGTSALAVPVRHADGQVLAGLAVTAIKSRLPPERVPRMVEVMERHARQIASQWGERSRSGQPVRTGTVR